MATKETMIYKLFEVSPEIEQEYFLSDLMKYKKDDLVAMLESATGCDISEIDFEE